jgi:hypothetical protein
MLEPVDPLIATPAVPATLPSRRWYGSLDAIADSERRALRSIGTTAREAAARTSAVLCGLLAVPGLRIFQGVHPAAGCLPRIPHAISSGHSLVLVDSVAWPPGRYTAPGGLIHCDGVYIGQSAVPLIAAVGYWREILPPGHRVSALVVVHPAGRGDLVLPAEVSDDLGWARADRAARTIRARLPCGRQLVSPRAFATLAAAAGDA